MPERDHRRDAGRTEEEASMEAEEVEGGAEAAVIPLRYNPRRRVQKGVKKRMNVREQSREGQR